MTLQFSIDLFLQIFDHLPHCLIKSGYFWVLRKNNSPLIQGLNETEDQEAKGRFGFVKLGSYVTLFQYSHNLVEPLIVKLIFLFLLNSSEFNFRDGFEKGDVEVQDSVELVLLVVASIGQQIEPVHRVLHHRNAPIQC